jgi:vacuolar-type H+-ATPase subunit I/STV1
MLIISSSIKTKYEALKITKQRLEQENALREHCGYTNNKLAEVEGDIEAKRKELDEIEDRIQERSEIEERLDEFEELEDEKERLEERVEELQQVEEEKEELERRLGQLEPFENLEGDRCFSTWNDFMTETIGAGWDNRLRYRYRRVKVLLVQWKSDDLGVSSEIDALAGVFTDYYNFEVSKFPIPDYQPSPL